MLVVPWLLRIVKVGFLCLCCSWVAKYECVHTYILYVTLLHKQSTHPTYLFDVAYRICLAAALLRG